MASASELDPPVASIGSTNSQLSPCQLLARHLTKRSLNLHIRKLQLSRRLIAHQHGDLLNHLSELLRPYFFPADIIDLMPYKRVIHYMYSSHFSFASVFSFLASFLI